MKADGKFFSEFYTWLHNSTDVWPSKRALVYGNGTSFFQRFPANTEQIMLKDYYGSNWRTPDNRRKPHGRGTPCTHGEGSHMVKANHARVHIYTIRAGAIGTNYHTRIINHTSTSCNSYKKTNCNGGSIHVHVSHIYYVVAIRLSCSTSTLCIEKEVLTSYIIFSLPMY
jgi:hypothetical protein